MRERQQLFKKVCERTRKQKLNARKPKENDDLGRQTLSEGRGKLRR